MEMMLTPLTQENQELHSFLEARKRTERRSLVLIDTACRKYHVYRVALPFELHACCEWSNNKGTANPERPQHFHFPKKKLHSSHDPLSPLTAGPTTLLHSRVEISYRHSGEIGIGSHSNRPFTSVPCHSNT